jgi:hypothetical protein
VYCIGGRNLNKGKLKMTKQYKDGHKKVLEFFSAENEKQCERNLYKFTSCGAWIEFHDWGIKLGSIVEGSDDGTDVFNLKYGKGFSKKLIQKTIDKIEEQAEAIWDWANEVREDGKTDEENGLDFPTFWLRSPSDSSSHYGELNER